MRFPPEGFIQFLSINYPRTVRERATLISDRTRNSKDGFRYFDLRSLVAHKGSYDVGKSGVFADIKAH